MKQLFPNFLLAFLFFSFQAGHCSVGIPKAKGTFALEPDMLAP
jgi:hypothetical protein